jgi:hypothetical protein
LFSSKHIAFEILQAEVTYQEVKKNSSKIIVLIILIGHF